MKRSAQFIAASTIALGALFASARSAAEAAEGPVAAGPIGGTDIRSAALPPPGLYGGVIGLDSSVGEIHDGTGHPAPGLDAVDLNAKIAAPFLVYVPDAKVFGGSIGVLGVFSAGAECGRVFSITPSRCITGFGDPYFEAAWSRSFGQLRPSRDAGAFPILEGLSVLVGLGAVIPIGAYDAALQRFNGLSLGNKTLDVAPSVAVTYTTPPLLAEGTELSAKLYWNQYWENPVTQYKASPLVDVDFAVSEHVGRFQVGVAGVYIFQTGLDRVAGVVVPPDGRRLEYMAVGPVLNYDMPDLGAAIRVKALQTILAHNSGVSRVFVVGFAKKLY